MALSESARDVDLEGFRMELRGLSWDQAVALARQIEDEAQQLAWELQKRWWQAMILCEEFGTPPPDASPHHLN